MGGLGVLAFNPWVLQIFSKTKIIDAKPMPLSNITSNDPIFSIEIGSKEFASHFKELSLSSHFALILGKAPFWRNLL